MKKGRLIALGMVVLAVGVALVAVRLIRGRQHPCNVLLITLDTTRADHLGCYGYKSALTPSLDRLAGAGVLFEQAFTCAPLTLPSHATMLTGLYPPEHALRINEAKRLDPTIPTLQEILRGQRYQTAAFIAAVTLSATAQANVLTVTLDTATPNFDVFRYRLDGGAWQSLAAPGSDMACRQGTLTWTLHSGTNTLDVKPRNLFALEGITSSATVAR